MALRRDTRANSVDPVRVIGIPIPKSLGGAVFWRRALLWCGVAAPTLAFAVTFLAMAMNPGLDPARRYLSELGGKAAAAPSIFNLGVFVAGVLAALGGCGFGLALSALTQARIVATLTVLLFLLSGYGLIQAALHPWPDPRHLAINLALGVQIAPLLLLWGLRSRRDSRLLKGFLVAVFIAMIVLTVLTKHLLLPNLVNDENVGLWERAYAIILVGWVGVASFALERRLREGDTDT